MGDRLSRPSEHFADDDALLSLRIQIDRDDARRLERRFGALADLDFSGLWPRLGDVLTTHVQKNIDQRRGTPPHGFRKLSDLTKLIRQQTGIPGVKPLVATGTLYRSFAIVRQDRDSMLFANTAESDKGFPYPEAVMRGATVPITAKMRAFFWAKFGIRLRSATATFGRAFSFFYIPPRNPYVVTPQMQDSADKAGIAWLDDLLERA